MGGGVHAGSDGAGTHPSPQPPSLKGRGSAFPTPDDPDRFIQGGSAVGRWSTRNDTGDSTHRTSIFRAPGMSSFHCPGLRRWPVYCAGVMLVQPPQRIRRPVPCPHPLRIPGALLRAIPHMKPRLVRPRHRLQPADPRQTDSSYRRSARATSPPAATRHAASAAPSSIACAAPCPMNGYIGWHASPSNVTRPTDHCGSGSRSNSAQMKQVSAAPMIRPICAMPSVERDKRAIDRRAIGPVLAVPGVVLGPADEIQQPPARDEVMHEMPAGPEP